MDPLLIRGVLLVLALLIIGLLGFIFMEGDEAWKKWIGGGAMLFIIVALTTLIIFGGG